MCHIPIFKIGQLSILKFPEKCILLLDCPLLRALQNKLQDILFVHLPSINLIKMILIQNNFEILNEYFCTKESANIPLKTNKMKAIKKLATVFKTEIIIFSSYMLILNVLLILLKIGL